MNRRVVVFLAALLVTASVGAQTNNEGFVMEGEGVRHLINHPDPVYPPIAKAAHVQGSVLLHVSVDATGKITRIDVIGGPDMLKGAALDAVKHWTYRPFEVDGKTSSVKVIVSVPFSLGIPEAQEKADDAIGQAYFPKADECRAANAVGHWEEAVKICGDLVTIANRFPDPSERKGEIRLAHEEFGEALAFSGDLPAALTQFHQDVTLAEKTLTPTDAEYGTAYYWLAFAEHASHMLVEAERDYSTAEASYRKAIVNLPEMKQIYSRYLAHTLAYHSVLANQTGQPDRAKAMRQEAEQLDPKSLDGIPTQK